MSQISITLLRLGFLILLWALVLSAIGVLRADLYGTRVTSRGKGLARRRKADARAQKMASPSRSATGVRAGGMLTRESTAAHLAVVAGPLKGTVIPLGSAPVLIGRAATCTVVIEDDYCSSRHCRVYPDDGQWMVEDLGSTNGTYLSNQRVDDPVPFHKGDRLSLGATAIELRS